MHVSTFSLLSFVHINCCYMNGAASDAVVMYVSSTSGRHPNGPQMYHLLLCHGHQWHHACLCSLRLSSFTRRRDVFLLSRFMFPRDLPDCEHVQCQRAFPSRSKRTASHRKAPILIQNTGCCTMGMKHCIFHSFTLVGSTIDARWPVSPIQWLGFSI